ncbi:unnamed protein product [Pylaiella littoralis]
MSAAVSQAPALPVHDIEAPLPTAVVGAAAAAAAAAAGTNGRQPQGHEHQATAAVEVEAEPDAGAGAGDGSSATGERPRRGLGFPFFVIGFGSLMSLVFILGDLINRRGFHPVSTGFFLLSTSYCVAIWRRHREITGAAVALSGQPSVLTKEARETLLTYFIFAHQTVAADAAEGKVGQPQLQQQQQQPQGKGLPSSAALLDSSSGSRRWRWERNAGSGRETGRESGASSGGGGRQDNHTGTNTDTDETPVSTPIASPGPATPVPSEQQPHPHGAAAAAAAATAFIAHAGRELLEDEEDDKEDEEVGGGGASRDQSCDRPSAAAGDLAQSRSETGEWSTDLACIVCFGDYADGDRLCRLPCRHVYHAECIHEWLDRARLPSCPLCKTNLLLAESSSTRNGNAAAGGTGDGGAVGPDVQAVELTGDNAV